MRLAGSNEYYDQLSASSRKQNSANQFETVIEQIELLREKGLGSDAAIHHGLNIWNGNEDAVQPSPRFAAIYGDDTADDPESSSPN